MQVCFVKLFKAEGKKLISFQIELRCSELLSIVLKLKKYIFSTNFRTIILFNKPGNECCGTVLLCGSVG